MPETTTHKKHKRPELQFKPRNPWLCNNCKWILGQGNADGSEICIKYKDLYVYVSGGDDTKVKVPCRRCGTINTVTTNRAVKS